MANSEELKSQYFLFIKQKSLTQFQGIITAEGLKSVNGYQNFTSSAFMGGATYEL